MATKTLTENITQAINDFDAIKTAIVAKGVDVPVGTPTSDYGVKIDAIPSGAEPPAIGFVPTKWDANGRIEEGDFYGRMPSYYFYIYLQGTTTLRHPYVIQSLRNINIINADIIGIYAFYRCSSLTSVSLPESLNYISNYSFEQCSQLNLEELPGGITYIGEGAFKSCVELRLQNLPDELTQIDTAGFSGCIKLALTSLPDGLTSIRDSVFSGCTNLALTSLPDGLTSIGGSAFRSCTNLALTSLPDRLTSIGQQAFYNCIGLTTITFNSKPTTLYNNAFQDCTNLLTINVPWSLGEVAGAPFGATNATINYNVT